MVLNEWIHYLSYNKVQPLLILWFSALVLVTDSTAHFTRLHNLTQLIQLNKLRES